MNHSPAYIMAQRLIQEGLLTDPSESGDWKVYVGVLPDGKQTEDDIVASIDTTPIKDGRLMTGANIFHHGVQLLLRSRNHNEGYAKTSALVTAFEGIDDVTVSIGDDSYLINSVTQITGIIALGQEEGTKRRVLFSVNFIVTMKET